MESRKRSLAKAMTWRALGIFILGVLAWIFTRSWQTTTAVTILFHVIQGILYYFHERFWDGVDWGFKNRTELTEQEREKVMERLRKLGYLD